VYVDSQELIGGSWGPATPAADAFDGNPNTFWNTQWYESQPPTPHEIQIDLGKAYTVAGFTELPRQDGVAYGRIGSYEFYVSMDGTNWGTPTASGAFSNTAAATQVTFTPREGRYVRLRALSTWDGDITTSLAELNVLTSDSLPPEGTITTPVGRATIPVGGWASFAGTGTDVEGNLPLTYHWNFGAGSGVPDQSSQNPGLLQFTNAGTFTVSFTVTDSLGNPDPVPDSRVITVLPPGPATFIPQTAWSLWFADSESIFGENGYGEDGAGENAFDGNPNTFWLTEYVTSQIPPPHEIEINLGAMFDIAGFSYLPPQGDGAQSAGESHGRIADYEFYVSADGVNWGAPVASGRFPDSPQAQQVLFNPKAGQFVQLRELNEANDQIYGAVAELNVLAAGSVSPQPTGSITFPPGPVAIAAGSTIDFTASGNDPGGNLPLTYRWNFQTGSGVADINGADTGLVRFTRPGTFLATCRIANSLGVTTEDTREITVLGGAMPIPKANWSLWIADSQETNSGNYAATNAFDGNTNTFWLTQSTGTAPWPPHELQINLGADYDIGGFRYLPRQDGSSIGDIGLYRFYVSADGTNWGSPVAYGTFTNSPAEQQVLFASTRGRYVRLQATSEANGQPYTAVAELDVLQAPVISPSVRLIQPTSDYLQPSNDLQVIAEAAVTNGEGVRIAIDGGGAGGGTQTDIYAAPYIATFAGLGLAAHFVDVYMIDSNGIPLVGVATHDQATNVGVGNLYVAMGDSITAGYGDDIHTDDVSTDGRTTGGGYEPILANLLEASNGIPDVIINEGIPGDASADGVALISLLLQRDPNAKRFLVMYGTNDREANGLGLNPGDAGYAGSFKDNLQRIINDINSAGKTVVIAKPPVWQPLDNPDDLRVQGYISVIGELEANPTNHLNIIGPDFHSYFASHPDEMHDTLHPNGVGYQAMASLWFQALNP
jgi:lysophospholipase L1-like esterase